TAPGFRNDDPLLRPLNAFDRFNKRARQCTFLQPAVHARPVESGIVEIGGIVVRSRWGWVIQYAAEFGQISLKIHQREQLNQLPTKIGNLPLPYLANVSDSCQLLTDTFRQSLYH